ncbi:MAG: AMP-binding protein [Vicinamibacterales bacterium]
MRRETLLDFFADFSNRPQTFVVHDDGYRVREASYRDVALAARRLAGRFEAFPLAPGEKIVIWSENSAEWIVAFWACLLARAVLVPVDYRSTDALLERISQTVRARLLLVGNEVRRPALEVPIWTLRDVIDWPAAHITQNPDDRLPLTGAGVTAAGGAEGAAKVTGATLAEIIFTSGATADPKGVTITHRNVLANIIPIEREIAKYRKWARPFEPIRFLNLLPLSHMFGQSLATFVPPMLSGTVVFSHGFSPVEILRQIQTRRISVLVCVPKVLDVLREHVQRVLPHTGQADPLAGRHWLWRWWHYRDVHRLFGWKFWCIVCGAAPLDPELEAFWRKLGLPVIQGYGLTETAPVVTLNHPFRASTGTVGSPIAGVEVRIAPDGEILVRGDNVSSGYYVPEGASTPAAPDADAFSDGWFHTGDIGALDASGRLLIKGRKKEMIVTPQGLNVFPEDIERVLLAQPGVKDAGVIGVRHEGEERIHAVLVLHPGADAQAVVRAANARLEDHQRIWSADEWPESSLPRTEGTQKLKRRELQHKLASSHADAAPFATGRPSTVADVLSRYAAGQAITPATTLEELGLSSLDRVELMMALEEVFQTTLDESAMAGPRTVSDIEALVAPASDGAQALPRDSGRQVGAVGSTPAGDDVGRASGAGVLSPIREPSWNRSRLAWLLRRASLPTWILPLGRLFMRIEVQGLQHLTAIHGPVLFASNHQSHLDTPALLSALPPRWRYWLAPAMAKEFFQAHFNPKAVPRKTWFTNSLNYYLACEFFNAFPLPQREAGTRQTLRYIGEILAGGYSVLIFPEGKRSADGQIGSFRPGVGMIASRLDVPVVPVRLDGLDRVLHSRMRFPKRGFVRVAFGAPLRLRGEDYRALAQQVEEAVRRL